MDDFNTLFNESLSHSDGLLGSALDYIRRRDGKHMRPMLILLTAKNFGTINDTTMRSAVGLELTHTASLAHDDVVDESRERRGQASVNEIYNNKVAVLVGDYILSSAVQHVIVTQNMDIMRAFTDLSKTLSEGEILQLQNIGNQEISEEIYFRVIYQKTAKFFETCATIGAMSVEADAQDIAAAREFGKNIGMIFQIRDDIFDYYDDAEIGKPTGNDMAEGKLTLPVIYALNSTRNVEMMEIARKVKAQQVSPEEIARLVAFTKANGGIEYAVHCMGDFHANALQFINSKVTDEALRKAFTAYLDYVMLRNK